MSSIEIIETKRIQDEINNHDGIEVKFKIDGEERVQCFAGESSYWNEIIKGEERWLTQLKENLVRQRAEESNKSEHESRIKITHFKEYGGKKYEI